MSAGDVDFVYTSICRLENETFDRKIFEKLFLEAIHNPGYLYLIAENAAEKAGLITLHTQYLLHHCGIVGELQEFYIAPAYRGLGTGRRLMEEVLNYARLHNLVSLEVTTNKRRTENIAIYEHLGFSLTHHKFTRRL